MIIHANYLLAAMSRFTRFPASKDIQQKLQQEPQPPQLQALKQAIQHLSQKQGSKYDGLA